LRNVEVGIEMAKLKRIEITGIAMKSKKVNVCTLKMNKFRKKLATPINTDVMSDKNKVANTFCIQLPVLKSPMIKSLLVRAIKGPLIFPRKERIAGTIKMIAEKLSKGIIKMVRISPAQIDPIMEMVSDGTVSLTIRILESLSFVPIS
jgi:hypothetical protein